jgi:hypothetical protein
MERHSALRFELQDGHEALKAAAAGIDEALAAMRPSPAQWSILECVEHVVVSEQLMVTRLRAAAESVAPVGSADREAALFARGRDRTRPAQAPPAARPIGRFGSLLEALAAFDAVRQETLEWLERFDGDLRAWATEHPAVPGGVNCHEVLTLIAVHPARHAAQIDAIKAALNSGARSLNPGS